MSNYRPAEIKRPGAPVTYYELEPRCDICKGHRAHGNHKACSKKRQARYQAEKGIGK